MDGLISTGLPLLVLGWGSDSWLRYQFGKNRCLYKISCYTGSVKNAFFIIQRYDCWFGKTDETNTLVICMDVGYGNVPRLDKTYPTH